MIFKTAKLSTGRTYSFVDEVPSRGPQSPVLLCLHGFPDSWFGWRNQIGPWCRAGYRVVVPDMLGYGGTDKPVNPDEYSTKKLCADLAALLDYLLVERAIVIGHDWGSYTAARFALWQPDRLSALILIAVPYTPPSPQYISITDVAKRAPSLSYQAYFADEISTREIEANLPAFLHVTFSSWSDNPEINLNSIRDLVTKRNVQELRRIQPSLLSDEEMKFYLERFSKGGMNGPLSYYRTALARHEEEKIAGLPSNLAPDLPVLYLYGTRDPTALHTVAQRSSKFIRRYHEVALEDKGHWLLLEDKHFITKKILEWLSQVAPLHSIAAKL